MATMRVDPRPTPAERADEQDGIAKLARLDANGLHVELFHILTFT
jgi:hypothetical protein